MSEEEMGPSEPDVPGRVSRRRRLALMGAGTLAGIGAVAALAAWSGTAVVSETFASGEFEVEIRTDLTDDEAWVAAEDGESAVSIGLPVADITWGPGDAATADFEIRLNPDSTHDGYISGISLEATSSTDADMDLAWSISSGADVWTSLSGRVNGESLSSADFVNISSGTGDIIVGADGEAVPVQLDLEAGSEVDQETIATADWSFEVEMIQP